MTKKEKITELQELIRSLNVAAASQLTARTTPYTENILICKCGEQIAALIAEPETSANE